MLQKSPPPAETPVTQSDIAAVLRTSRPSRRIGRRVVWAVVAVLALGGLWYLFAGGSGGTQTVYTTEPAAVGDLTVTVTATGTVEPTNEVELSSELSGTVASVEVDFNSEVASGQVLARLKTDQLEANVALARATLAARESEVRHAQATVDERTAALSRTEQLVERAISSTEALETARAASDRADAALAGARANLDIARANLDIAESNLAKAAIVSPIDGVVLARNVEVGQIVAASFSAPVLFTLAEDLAEMQVQVDVDEADMGAVSEGQPATFTVEAFRDRTFPATIAQVRLSPETVEGVVTYQAILSVENPDLLLRPGMTATAEIVVDDIDGALLVPNAALRFAPPAAAAEGGGSGLLGLLLPSPPSGPTTPTTDAEGRRTIWVLRDGAPVAVQVETGASDGNHTVIESGELAAGDAVIVASRTGT